MTHQTTNVPLAYAAVIPLAAALLGGCDETRATPTELHEEDLAAQEVRISPDGEEFDDLEVFFEFNSTDDDLGFQLFLDADGWERLAAEDPAGKRILDFVARKELGELGITELRFESAEPSPAEVLASFPAGTYTFGGRTVEGEALFGTAALSHSLPPPAVFTPADGDEVDASSVVIEWDFIAGLAGYEVIVENEDAGLSMTVELGPDATSLTVPAEFLEPDGEYKVEVLTVAMNGNKTIVEHVFTTSP